MWSQGMNYAFHAFGEEGMIKSWQKGGFRRPDEQNLHFHPSMHGDLPWPKKGGPGNAGEDLLCRRHQELRSWIRNDLLTMSFARGWHYFDWCENETVTMEYCKGWGKLACYSWNFSIRATFQRIISLHWHWNILQKGIFFNKLRMKHKSCLPARASTQPGIMALLQPVSYSRGHSDCLRAGHLGFLRCTTPTYACHVLSPGLGTPEAYQLQTPAGDTSLPGKPLGARGISTLPL